MDMTIFHILWGICGDFIDLWKCPGFLSFSGEQKAVLNWLVQYMQYDRLSRIFMSQNIILDFALPFYFTSGVPKANSSRYFFSSSFLGKEKFNINVLSPRITQAQISPGSNRQHSWTRSWIQIFSVL